MRSLTDAEGRVLRVLLADLEGPERVLVRAAEVPRTTFQTIRHRAFLNGWVKTRYIPNPRLIGSGGVRFVLAQPYSEHWASAVQSLRSMPKVAVLWASPETLFGVLFGAANSALPEGLVPAPWLCRSYSVSVTGANGGVPAYFDYDGAWSRWTASTGSMSYPRSLANSATRSKAPYPPDVIAVRGLVVRPFAGSEVSSGSRLPGTGRLSRQERRLIREGWVERRTIPDLAEIPAVHGNRPERVVFVTGSRKPGVSPPQLFADLASRASVAPFVYAYDAERVLLLALSPAPSAAAGNRASVSEILGTGLERIEVIREPIQSLLPVVDHRYDRLILHSPEVP